MVQLSPEQVARLQSLLNGNGEPVSLSINGQSVEATGFVSNFFNNLFGEGEEVVGDVNLSKLGQRVTGLESFTRVNFSAVSGRIGSVEGKLTLHDSSIKALQTGINTNFSQLQDLKDNVGTYVKEPFDRIVKYGLGSIPPISTSTFADGKGNRYYYKIGNVDLTRSQGWGIFEFLSQVKDALVELPHYIFSTTLLAVNNGIKYYTNSNREDEYGNPIGPIYLPLPGVPNNEYVPGGINDTALRVPGGHTLQTFAENLLSAIKTNIPNYVLSQIARLEGEIKTRLSANEALITQYVSNAKVMVWDFEAWAKDNINALRADLIPTIERTANDLLSPVKDFVYEGTRKFTDMNDGLLTLGIDMRAPSTWLSSLQDTLKTYLVTNIENFLSDQDWFNTLTDFFEKYSSALTNVDSGWSDILQLIKDGVRGIGIGITDFTNAFKRIKWPEDLQRSTGFIPPDWNDPFRSGKDIGDATTEDKLEVWASYIKTAMADAADRLKFIASNITNLFTGVIAIILKKFFRITMKSSTFTEINRTGFPKLSTA